MIYLVKLDYFLKGFVNIWLNKWQNNMVRGQIVKWQWIKVYLLLCCRFEAYFDSKKKAFIGGTWYTLGKNNFFSFVMYFY